MLTSRPPATDTRGSLTKILGEADQTPDGPFAVREVFWSRSVRGVFRGLHVQLPPRATRKLVFVTDGVVRDFLLDLRRGSPAEGVLWETELSPATGGLLVPDGCAHGFEVLSDDASMVYLQEDFHSAPHDGGVHFASAGLVLASGEPLLSDRDRALGPLADFDSPFTFEPA
jgi:dTDP-4-dehydrorhamnose 3,5-epimerase